MFVWRTRNRVLGTLLGCITVSPLLQGAHAQDVTSLTLNGFDPCAKSPSATVHLTAPAPAGGLVLQLTSSLPANASVPATMSVKQGVSKADFQISCVPSTQAVAATITAKVTGHPITASAVLNILAPVLSSVTVQPHTGGKTVDGKVTLVGNAPPGGVVVTLSSSSTKAVVPAFVTVPANASTVSFQIQTKSVSQVTTASIIGTGLGVTKTFDLVMQPPRPVAMGFNTKPAPTTLLPTKSVEGENGAGVGLILGNDAPCCNFTVQLTSSNPAVVTVPATVTFDNNATLAQFGVSTKPVNTTTSVTITATSGGASVTCVITVIPNELKSFSLQPTTVIGGQNSQGKLFYFHPAPAGGIRVTLTSSNTDRVAVPKQLTVPAGAQELLFPIETNGLENRATVTVSVDAEGQKKSAQLELVPEGPAALTISPNPMVGGTNTKAFVDAVNGSDAFVVNLNSSAPGVVDVPSSVSFTKGVTRREFMVSATPVLKDTTVTVTAMTTSNAKGKAGTFTTSKSSFTVTRSVSLKISAPVVTALSFNDNTVTGGTQASGQVTISGKAPAGGMPISISSNNISTALVSAAVKVPAGATSVTFTVGTTSVSASTNVLFTAFTSGSSATRSASLTVLKP